MNTNGTGDRRDSGGLRDVSDPAGALATDAVKALDAWLRDHPGCTHGMDDERHVLRDRLGILIASNPDLATAVSTAEARELAALNDRDHPVTPVVGTATRTKTGFGAAPANLMDRTHYPVEAICQVCGEIVRIEIYAGTWKHTGRRPGAPRYGEHMPPRDPRECPALEVALPADTVPNETWQRVGEPREAQFGDGSWRPVQLIAEWTDQHGVPVVQLEWHAAGTTWSDAYIVDAERIREPRQ